MPPRFRSCLESPKDTPFRGAVTVLAIMKLDQSAQAAIAAGGIALLRASWLLKAARRGSLGPRESLPPEAFIPPASPPCPSRIVCVSHVTHPDPSIHLRSIANALSLLISAKGGDDWAVFWDDFSLVEIHTGRRPSVAKRLQSAAVRSLFSHPSTYVFLLTCGGEIAGPSYYSSGRCVLYSSLATLVKGGPLSDKVLDLGKDTGAATHWRELEGLLRADRRPPLTPAAFAEFASTLELSTEAERALTVDLYRCGFNERMSSVECLYFSALGWGDEEVRLVAAVLAEPALFKLESVVLNGNDTGAPGLQSLLDALPLSSPRLAELDVRNQHQREPDEVERRLRAECEARGILVRT